MQTGALREEEMLGVAGRCEEALEGETEDTHVDRKTSILQGLISAAPGQLVPREGWHPTE